MPFPAELLGFTFVAPTSTDAARHPLRLTLADLEDAFQVVAALRFGAERIITRNIHDYKRSPIQAMTPSQFIASCGE